MDMMKPKPQSRSKFLLLRHLIPASFLFVIASVYFCYQYHNNGQLHLASSSNPDSLCPIPDLIKPSNPLYSEEIVRKIIHNDAFRNESLFKLLGSVQVPTEVYDEWGLIDEHPEHWEVYEDLHEYLKKTFPLIDKKLTLEKIYAGLLYTWEGSDSSLKPIVLMAHQDVVPVQKETIKDWTYPPYEGAYDGEFVWGRGASDCKCLLVGIMELIELLIAEDFKPKRTIILSFGADEEAIGRSLYLLSRHLLEKYGEDSIHLILDEGGSGLLSLEDKYFLEVHTGEKGYLDAQIELFTPGGHSSVPQDHTSIGIMSELVQEIEHTPYSPLLTNVNPLVQNLQCFAEHSQTIDKKLKSDILKSHIDEDSNKAVVDWLISQSPVYKYLITTSQAVDIVQGGAKSNALPEHVSILVNNRIAVESSVQLTSDKLRDNILKIARKYDLGLIIESETLLKPTENGYFQFTYRDPLQTAPVTPINDDIWDSFVGTLRHLYEEEFYPDVFRAENDKEDYIIVTPALSTGNTDTKSYWDLTDHIYRFIPGSKNKFDSHAHSVDEKVDMDSHLFIIAFYYEYLLNLDHELE